MMTVEDLGSQERGMKAEMEVEGRHEVQHSH